MKSSCIRRGLWTLVAVAVVCAAQTAQADKPKSGKHHGPKSGKKEGSVLSFKVKDIDGKEVALSRYHGKVLLIVNTASKCGYTPQYAKLEELQQKYGSKGFDVLGFPSNDFGQQEPGSNAEIKKFCETKYHVTFPMFAKVVVKGAKSCALYKFLTSSETNPEFAGDIQWNFTKFLVDRSGKVIARFKSSDDPVKNKQLIEQLEKSLAQKS